MQRIVQKFGGTSVGSISKIIKACELIQKEFENGNQVVVVSSAMSGETNKLVNLAENFDVSINKKEYDMIVSTGEQISIALIAMALKRIGISAKPLLGWQVPIIGSSNHTEAKINKIDDTSHIRRPRYVILVSGLMETSSCIIFFDESSVFPDSISKLIFSENRPFAKLKCCLAKISVGAIKATW